MTDEALLIDKIIKKNQSIFRISGMNIRIEEKTSKHKYYSWFMYLFNLIWFNTDTVGAIVWLATGIAQKKKLTELTYISPCITICWLGNIKIFYTVTNEMTIDVLIDDIRKFEIEQRNRPKDLEAEKIIQEEDDYLNKIIKVLYIFYSILLIAFAVGPLMLMLLIYLETNEVELILPFSVVYPFDAFNIRYYPYVFLRQIWSEVAVVVGIGAADVIFYVFCVYLRIQFRLLKLYIEKVIPSESNKRNLNEEEIRLKLVELIKWHQKILSSVDVLETMFTRSTLFNFITSSLLICFTGFNVVAYDGIALSLPFFFFLVMSLLQIFFLCFFGNLLMESSIEVSDAVYNTNWQSVPSLGMILLVVQTRSQTPCKLTAAKFADVNLKSFMRVCSTAWSYFALLQTLYTPT